MLSVLDSAVALFSLTLAWSFIKPLNSTHNMGQHFLLFIVVSIVVYLTIMSIILSIVYQVTLFVNAHPFLALAGGVLAIGLIGVAAWRAKQAWGGTSYDL